MLYLRFSFETDEDGNSVLISINGDTARAGQHWSMTVGGVSQKSPINEYIPPEGVTVVFKKTLFSADADEGRLLKILIGVLKLIDRNVNYSDDLKLKTTDTFGHYE